jgi:hypothetical protein
MIQPFRQNSRIILINALDHMSSHNGVAEVTYVL